MKSLPLKLGIFVVLLFALVTAACLLWTPIKMKYFSNLLASGNLSDRIRAADVLINHSGQRGKEVLIETLGLDEAEYKFIYDEWNTKRQVDSILRNAIKNKYANALDLLLPHFMGGDNEEELGDLLHYAVEMEDPEVVKVLIRHGADINTQNKVLETPLNYALRYGKKDIAETLILLGADVNIPDKQESIALHYAAYCAWDNLGRLIIPKTTNLEVADRRGFTPLHAALYALSWIMIGPLVEAGANVNSKSADEGSRGGQTPLHRLAESGSAAGFKYFIEKGANVNLKDNGGNTPLHSAIFKSIVPVKAIKLLIDNGADLNVLNNKKRTPLYYAVAVGREEVVKILIANRADVNLVCEKGYTALHKAVSTNRISICKLLLSGGAIVNMINDEGFTPLDVAKDGEIITLLRSHGGKTAEEMREQENK
ncbi:MAG: ankyrin repeat domain-containing protein [Planctomycetota bacterium]|jgi:serine/threonine-protein phosphatase 6 regulatory ankyrin repeat subunit B